jgi:hypothetical protein
VSDQYVYFIQADENGPIKIGFTSDDPKKRLNQLQTGNPAVLKLLGAIKGTVAREKELHARLAEWRLQGEWFQSHSTVLSTIQEAMANINEPINCGGPHCSFCGVCQHDTSLLIAAEVDGTFICARCSGDCARIAGEHLLKLASVALSDAEMDMEFAA